MDEIYSNSSESEYDDGGPLPPDQVPDPDDEVTDCLHYKGKKYEDLVMEDLEGVEFKSVAEIDQFYSYYSLAVGFSLRKHKADKNTDQQVRRRQLCSREGERRSQASKRQKFSNDRVNGRLNDNCDSNIRKIAPPQRQVTRCNCPARFTARLCKTRGVYYVTEFVTEHNHDLVRPEHVHFLRSHRQVRDHVHLVSSTHFTCYCLCHSSSLKKGPPMYASPFGKIPSSMDK